MTRHGSILTDAATLTLLPTTDLAPIRLGTLPRHLRAAHRHRSPKWISPPHAALALSKALPHRHLFIPAASPNPKSP